MSQPVESGGTQVNDELLVIRCQLGERRAFDELAMRWGAPVAGYARRVSQDNEAAADLTQDIWVRVFRGVDRLRDPSRFRSWLFAIAHLAFIDALRSRYDALQITVDDSDQVAADEEESQYDLPSVELGLALLPPAEREILTLFYLQELTVEETAQALSIPAGTVKSRLHRARRLLRFELKKGDLM
jgi:RNA polymerase sigma factor (sigma-70 family)